MIDQEALSSEQTARALVERIESLVTEPVSLMEVCGTHTVAISRFGLRSMLPADLRLLSGPGCPVCVTPLVEIDRAIAGALLVVLQRRGMDTLVAVGQERDRVLAAG